MSCIRQLGNSSDQRATWSLYKYRQKARWRDAASMATRSVPGLGRYVPRTVRIESRDSRQERGWLCCCNSRCALNSKVQRHYLRRCRVDFVPVAIETSGVWGRQALDLVNEIGRRIAAVTHEPHSTAFLRQRISEAVQRGNAYCVLGTLQSSRNVD